MLLIIVVKFSLFFLLKTSFYNLSLKDDYMAKRYLQSTKPKWCKCNVKIIATKGKQNKWINLKNDKTNKQNIDTNKFLKT